MRKSTTPVHIGLGMVAALTAPHSPGLAILLMGSFGAYEYWSEARGESGGHEDFLEAVLGLALGAVAILLAAATA